MSQTKQEELREFLIGVLNDDISLLRFREPTPQASPTAWSGVGKISLSKRLSHQVTVHPSPWREGGALGELSAGSNQQDEGQG